MPRDVPALSGVVLGEAPATNLFIVVLDLHSLGEDDDSSSSSLLLSTASPENSFMQSCLASSGSTELI